MKPTLETDSGMEGLALARAAKPKFVEWLSRAAVTASVGITRKDGTYGLKVNLQSPLQNERMPEEFEGVPVTTEVVGPLRKQG